MRERTATMLVSRNRAAVYECINCGTETALYGSCRGCGCPSLVEYRPTRRRARPPMDWMLTLAHNLAVAGFGALMFRAGDNFGFHMGQEEYGQCTCQWAPGDGEPYRPSRRCEQDAFDEDEDDGYLGEIDDDYDSY